MRPDDVHPALNAASNEFARATPESIDRLASELHLVAERLRHAAAFRSALARASVEEDQEPVEYLHP